jgi:putative mycofactocin binding protein MftB
VSLLDAHFDVARAWRLSARVSLREEAFGALAYHHDSRRLVFLKSPTLVALVRSLENHESAEAAITALVSEGQRTRYERALEDLASAGVLDVR